MCYYITATFPNSADAALLSDIGRRHSVALVPCHNSFLQEQLYPGESQYLTSRGRCNCGTVLGSRRKERGFAHDTNAVEQKISRLRKSGWSETKVQRWCDQNANVATRKERVLAEHAGTRTSEVNAWQQFVTQSVLEGGSPYVGLLLHWHGGMLEGAEVRIVRSPVELSSLQPGLFLDFKEDVLYTFVNG